MSVPPHRSGPAPGLYIIKNRDEGKWVGQVEADPPLIGAPNKVVSLPGGVRAPVWHLSKRPDGQWIITSEGHTAFPMDKKIYGLPMPHATAFAWNVEPVVVAGGANTFIIKKPEAGPITTDNEATVWVVSEPAAYTQVELVTFTRPPPTSDVVPHDLFPKGSIFEFVAAPKDE